VRQRVEERRLAGVRQADDPDLQRHVLPLEADAPFTGEALRVQDARQHENDAAVLCLERDRAGARGAELSLERVGAVGRDQPAEDLPAVEGDLDAYVGVVRQRTPPP
jgi:hypothetical protein